MYDPTVGRFLQEDPSGLAGGDTNFYRYCGNDPVSKTDPTGLAALPLPAPPAGSVLPPTLNLPMAWYRRPYGLAPYIPAKPKIIKKVGEVKPTNCGIALKPNVRQNEHKVAGLPLVPNSYFGVDGAGPCIGVVVVCPSQVVAFHFDQGKDDAGATLSQYTWPKGSHAVICGGDNSPVSNDQLIEVINSLANNGIKLDGIVNMKGCYYGPGGKWYVGSTTMPCPDTQKQ